MKTLKSTAVKMIAIALLPLTLSNTLEAADTLDMSELGYLAYDVKGRPSKQIPIATTVITRSSIEGTKVTVSQVFDNASNNKINAEYFFPVPENAELTAFNSSAHCDIEEDLPIHSVSIAKGESVNIAYQYVMNTDDFYQASVMGFQSLPPQKSSVETKDAVEMVASN